MCNHKIAEVKVCPDRIIVIDNAGVSSQHWYESHHFAVSNERKSKFLSELGRRLYDGKMMFPDGIDTRAKRAYERCKERFGTIRNGRENRERFAREFARRCMRGTI